MNLFLNKEKVKPYVGLKLRIWSSVLLIIWALFLVLCMINFKTPFVLDSVVWDIIIRIVVVLQLLTVLLILLKEFLKTIARKKVYIYIAIAFFLSFFNVFFYWDVTSSQLYFLWNLVSSEGVYLGNLIKTVFILGILLLISSSFKVWNLSLTTVFALFIILIAIPFLISALEDNKLIDIILVITLSIFFDVISFFIGRKFGKKRPFLYISPNKTMAGYVGGIGFSFSLIFIIYGIIGIITKLDNSTLLVSKIDLYIVAALLLFLAIMSASGDLLFSKVKRDYGIKDFGTFLPGHGGLLDRLDGIITTLFVFSLFLPIL